ncbi:hypothetical protein HY797_00090 [Candidatus Falkowbacteria bacterium]|nr:hypothetical protein [Candidatus Falkowbacteria bacterium]
MAKEISNNEILTAIKENQKAIKENSNTIKESQNAIAENQKEIKEMRADSQEILEAINAFSGETDKRFAKLENKVNSLPDKNYLDEKLSDLRGDLVVLTRKEDTKVKKLVKIMKKRKLLNDNEVKEIMSMEPFPQLSL